MLDAEANTNSALKFIYLLRKRWYLVAIIAVIVLTALYLATFRERTLALSYAGQTCDQRLILLPGTFVQGGENGYKIIVAGGWKLGGIQLFSTSVCVEPIESPDEYGSKTLTFSPWGGWFARLTYRIDAGQYPSIDTAVLDEAVPATHMLTLPLSVADKVFEYHVQINKSQANCELDDRQVVCDVPSLNLKQKTTYDMLLERTFNGEAAGQVAQTKLVTLSALSVKSTSIKQGAMVYAKPRSLTLTFDKALKRADFSAERVDSKAPLLLKTNTKIDGNKATVTFADDLPREAKIQLKAKALEAKDGSTTLNPYVLTFTTSGGPKVTGISIGQSGVARKAIVTVRFDQPIDKTDPIEKYIKTTGVGSSNYSIYGNTVSLQLSGSDCKRFSVQVAKGIKSASNGEKSATAWSYNSRIICGYAWTVGYSVEGRPIVAYSIGNGDKVVMFTGGMHGSELSGYQTMQAWAEYLRANPDDIPSGVRVVVVPNTNPDGIARGQRDNAHGVNIDRNFPDSTWVSDIQSSNGSHKGGGGKKPASEPETKAIMKLTRELRPRLQVSFHAQGSLVGSNNTADADVIGHKYANATGYATMFQTAEDVMGYELTGQYEMWEAEELGLPAILIELPTHSGNYLYSQLPALRLMLGM